MALPLNEHSLPGTLVAVCGMDGSGKTTLIKGLTAHLVDQGHRVVSTIQPTPGAREAPLFQRYLYHPNERHLVDYRALICLLTSDRLQHIHEVVLPGLQDGSVVVTDRYLFTALAQMRARGYRDERWFVEISRHFPRPDLAVFCDPGFEVSQRRVAARSGWQESYIENEHDRRLYQEFQAVIDEEGLVRVDTDNTPEVTLARVVKLLEPRLPGARDRVPVPTAGPAATPPAAAG